MAPAPARGRRVTLVNQFFPPDLSPTAHLTASLAAHLAAAGHDVTVLTGGTGYVDAVAVDGPTTTPAPYRVVHMWTPALGKASIPKRLADYATFLAGAVWRMARLPRQDVVISLTTPPFVVLAALTHRLRHRRTRVVLWSMDCYPDVVERLGSVSMRRGGPASRVLRAVNRWTFRRLDHVVVLDEAMRDLLRDGYGTSDGGPPMTVVPNWEPLDAFPPPTPGDPGPWDGYEDADLADRFVVLYSGNLGYGHPVDTVLAAADEVAAEDVAWLFMGGGARWDELAPRSAARHVIRRPYVAKAVTPQVMAGAGCALILLADEALGVMSPSKLHANLAAGLPIVYVGPEGSNVDAAIARFGCGVSLRTGDATGLAAAVRRLRDDPAHRAELSVNARHAFETAYCDEAVFPAWDAIVDD